MISAQCIGFLNTPPLWKGKQFHIQQFEFPSLDLFSFEPCPIPQNIRLGHQMEYVFKQLVEYSGTYIIELYNLPIRKDGITLGEIDFILKDKSSNKLIHIELTCKFYIIDPEISEPIYSIIGPNRRDTFVTKMKKIRNVQFSLLHTEAGSKALRDKNIDPLKIEHQCCFKAQLFKPFNSGAINIGSLNNDCLAGSWLRFDDFNTAEFSSAQFYLPTKSEWIIKPTGQVVWKSHAEILVDIDKRLLTERAPMIWMRNTNAKLEKLFVVWW